MRCGYSEDCENNWELIMWRGAVASAIRGKRGQAFLRELLTALDALPDKRLIAEELQQDGEVCAIGSVGLLRKIDMEALDPEDYTAIAEKFGISEALVREIEYVNDEYSWYSLSPETRFAVVRRWVVDHLLTA